MSVLIGCPNIPPKHDISVHNDIQSYLFFFVMQIFFIIGCVRTQEARWYRMSSAIITLWLRQIEYQVNNTTSWWLRNLNHWHGLTLNPVCVLFLIRVYNSIIEIDINANILMSFAATTNLLHLCSILSVSEKTVLREIKVDHMNMHHIICSHLWSFGFSSGLWLQSWSVVQIFCHKIVNRQNIFP